MIRQLPSYSFRSISNNVRSSIDAGTNYPSTLTHPTVMFSFYFGNLPALLGLRRETSCWGRGCSNERCLKGTTVANHRSKQPSIIITQIIHVMSCHVAVFPLFLSFLSFQSSRNENLQSSSRSSNSISLSIHPKLSKKQKRTSTQKSL